jgi:hypothetical protein
MTVRKTDLEPLTSLAEGGFGEVFQVADAFRLPGDPTPLVYKEFKEHKAAQARSAKAAVTFRAGLTDADRANLDKYSAWPRELVEDAGEISGCVMRLIPADYNCHVLNPKGGGMIQKARDLSWLITTPLQRQEAHADVGDVSEEDRLMVLAQLVYAVGRLHRHGWVFGDVSFKNAVYALDPPRLILLDCDGAAALSDADREQSSTPFWDPPECPIPPPGHPAPLQDPGSDVYKLGLAILRCLNPGKGAGTLRKASRLAGKLDAAGVDLVAHALSGDPGERPTAKELYEYLYRAVLSRIKVPEVLAARLASLYLLRGDDARIDWQIENATEATIVTGSGKRFPANLATHPRRFTFTPDVSGPVTLEIRNHLVTVSVDLGELRLVELPPFSVDLNYLPRPHVSAVPAFSLAPLAEIVARSPRATMSMPAVPPVPSPRAFDLIENLLPDGVRPVSLINIHEVVAETSNAVKDTILSEGNKFVATLRQAKLGG